MQIEATGKSVEIAIQNGLLECGMKREEVDIKILDQGGLFKKAKVLLSWGEAVVETPSEVAVSEPVVVTAQAPVQAEPVQEVKEEKNARQMKSACTLYAAAR